MGAQCAGALTRTPSALSLCQAFNRQATGQNIWGLLAQEEVCHVSEMVQAWADCMIDGVSARRQLQARRLRRYISPPRGGDSALSREIFSEYLQSSSVAALAQIVDHFSQTMQTGNEDGFGCIDSIFSCRLFREARSLAMRELGIDGAHALPDDVRSAFQQKALTICSSDRRWQEEASHERAGETWSKMIALCLCVEVLRHVRGSGEPLLRSMTLMSFGGYTRPAMGRRESTPNMWRRPQTQASFAHVDGGPAIELFVITREPVTSGAVLFGGMNEANTRDAARLQVRIVTLVRDERGHMPSVVAGLTTAEIEENCPLARLSASTHGCCPVCLEPEQAGELVRALRCGHRFHKECCEAWFRQARTCPTCRSTICRSRPETAAR